MSWKTPKRLFFILLLALQLSACAHYPINQQSHSFNKQTGYRFDNLKLGPRNTDDLFVCLTFSGGGTRAAPLAYGILAELNQTPIKVAGVKKSLLDEVDAISSVSGGSFTAAYYGLFREKIFADFQTKVLERNIQGALIAKLLNPLNLIRVASFFLSRSDLAAEYYDRKIFAGATFAQMQENGRPFVIINATNLGPGLRFDFTQNRFDAMGSCLDTYPVSRAVAASSAFPLLLSPLSLKNYPLPPDYQPPWWYSRPGTPKDFHTRRDAATKDLNFYLNKENTYVHVVDGGLADNIGVRAMLEEWESGFILKRINQGLIKRLVFIVVNAHTEKEDRLSRKAIPPGIITVAKKTGTTAMEYYSLESIDRLRSELYQRVQAQKNLDALQRHLQEYCPEAPKFPKFKENVDFYFVEINFADVARLPGEDLRYYLDLPTTFSLSKEQIEKLIAIGPRLLKASPQYKCLIKVLQAEAEAEAEGRPRPQDCPPGAGIVGN